MTRETTAKGVTIDEAVEKALTELGVSRDDCQIEVLETPRKTLFGKIKEAVVKVTSEVSEEPQPAVENSEPAILGKESTNDVAGLSTEEPNDKVQLARKYLEGIFAAMGLSGVQMKISQSDEGAVLTIDGEGIAVLIGHHGETLDALQYLVALACNRIGGDYYRITLDCGNYREKRETTLRALAARIGEKVKRTGRSQLLEPMNPYERRIIHSVVTEIEGVTSKSKGEEPNRRVVIMSENPQRSSYGRNNGRREDYSRKTSYPPRKRERTMEEILKSDFKEQEEKAELYSKIEL